MNKYIFEMLQMDSFITIDYYGAQFAIFPATRCQIFCFKIFHFLFHIFKPGSGMFSNLNNNILHEIYLGDISFWISVKG